MLQICVYVIFFGFFGRLSGANLSHPSAGPVPVAMVTGPSSAWRGCGGDVKGRVRMQSLSVLAVPLGFPTVAFKAHFSREISVRFSFSAGAGCKLSLVILVR